ncbi:MAG: hypothetical protein RR595_01440 [Lysinibacillus sp.]
MAKRRGTGVVLAGLAVGAASLLRKKENRDIALKMFNKMKCKLETYMESSKIIMAPQIVERITSEVAGEAGTCPTKLAADEMIAEGGAQTSVVFYNKEIQAKRT